MDIAHVATHERRTRDHAWSMEDTYANLLLFTSREAALYVPFYSQLFLTIIAYITTVIKDSLTALYHDCQCTNFLGLTHREELLQLIVSCNTKWSPLITVIMHLTHHTSSLKEVPSFMCHLIFAMHYSKAIITQRVSVI